MGFGIDPVPGSSRLTVWIDYELPGRGQGRRIPMFAAIYGRWCVAQMLKDAVLHLGKSP